MAGRRHRAPAQMNFDLAVEYVRATYPALASGVEFIFAPPEWWPGRPGCVALVARGATDALLVLERVAPVHEHVNSLVHELTHIAQHRRGHWRGRGEREARAAGREAARRYSRH